MKFNEELEYFFGKHFNGLHHEDITKKRIMKFAEDYSNRKSSEINLEKLSQELGYRDVNHLEMNVDNYGYPLIEWWEVIKKHN